MISLFILTKLIVVTAKACNGMHCSMVVDRVCAMFRARDGAVAISTLHNVCHLEKIACRLKDYAEVKHISMGECTEKLWNTRRGYDFGIVGAHQACNHSCPTYCVDTYEPACAQIWQRGMKKFSIRMMVNHCHIDLFSCAVGANVTILPIGRCFNNPSGMLFMNQMAALKSMGLLEQYDASKDEKKTPKTFPASRRMGFIADNNDIELENILHVLVNRLKIKRRK